MEHPLSDMMTNSMSKIRDMIDVNTVVGDPITTPGGVTIIPVTKVSIGYGGGGSDFAMKNMPANRDNPFGGGAGAGIKITPVAFLVIRGENVRMLPVAEPASTSVDRLIELLPDLLEKGELPLRVTHNDTKLNNVLLDPQTGCAKCVLDLDTVMPGLSAYDFGDGVRFGASSAAEDEKDLDQVWLKLDMYQAFLEGYLDACGHALTPKEIEVLPLGAKIITAELAMRFLKDYLDGDVYFKIDYPTQNLDRCRTQLKLVADMEAKWPEMQRILHETAAVRCAQPTKPQ